MILQIKLVLNIIIFKIPQLGRVQKILASKGGWLVFILIPALYIIGRDILRLTKLSSIKATATKMSEPKRKDPKKEKEEAIRKAELKRKLLKNDNSSKIEYYTEPTIKTVDKRRVKNDNNKSKNKKKKDNN